MALRKNERHTLGDYCLGRRRTKKTFLDDVELLIDWRPIERFLKKKIKRKANAVGSPAYPPLMMLKILLLQRWYNLSDEEVEFALCDRLSFVRFLEMSIEDDIPDSTTICRFRNGLVTLKINDALLNMLNEQLEAKNILIRSGTIVDASVVESCRRPRKMIDVKKIDKDRDEQEESCEISYSDDTDAGWLHKGRHFHYGYKLHMGTDAKDSFVLGAILTPANYSDTKQLPPLIDKIKPRPGTPVFADKGYTSQANRNYISDSHLQDGIMYRRTRGKNLSEEEISINRHISSIRYMVERTFGTLKQKYQFFRSRYVGIEKVSAEFHIIGMAFNIKKAIGLAFS